MVIRLAPSDFLNNHIQPRAKVLPPCRSINNTAIHGNWCDSRNHLAIIAMNCARSREVIPTLLER